MISLTTLTAEERATYLRPLLDLATGSLAALPSTLRADMYEAIAVAAGPGDLSAAALRTAAALREADTLQMTFATLLSQPAA